MHPQHHDEGCKRQERDKVRQTSRRSHIVDHRYRRINRHHQQNKADRRIRKVHRRADPLTNDLERKGKCCGVLAALENNRKGRDRRKQRTKTQAVERRGITEFDKAWAGRTIFHDRKHGRKDRDKRHNLRALTANSRQQK